VSGKYEFVDTTLTEPNNRFPTRSMCRWLEISTAGFYAWRTRPTSATATRRAHLRVLIAAEFTAADEAAGYRRIHAARRRGGVDVGRSSSDTSCETWGYDPASPARGGTTSPRLTPRPPRYPTSCTATSPPPPPG